MAQQQVKRVKGFSNNGVKWEGQKDFDQDYISIEIVDYVEKTGEGENDFVIKKKVVETREPIADVVARDADQVGVYNIIKQVMRTGDTSLLPMDDGKCQVDLVGAPETLMEVKAMGEDAAKKYAGLDPRLTKGRTLAEFVANLSNEELNEFINAVKGRQEEKSEEKVNE